MTSTPKIWMINTPYLILGLRLIWLHVFCGKQLSSWLTNLKVEVGATFQLLHRKRALCPPSHWLRSSAASSRAFHSAASPNVPPQHGWRPPPADVCAVHDCPRGGQKLEDRLEQLGRCQQGHQPHTCLWKQQPISARQLTQRWLLFKSRSMCSVSALNKLPSAMTTAKKNKNKWVKRSTIMWRHSFVFV